MSDARVFRPGKKSRTVVDEDGRMHHVPDGWTCLPPGDAGLTRKVKALGPSWTVKEKRGRRMFSQGVWAPTENIVKARAHVDALRASPAHQKKLEAGRKRRERDQAAYVREFETSVRAFLSFHPVHARLERQMAQAITAHATPVGSGTVARTKRIPVERRAQAATIAWMRHQTTAYDHMRIPRVKGRRREVRRMLAERSRALLQQYRDGVDGGRGCPLRTALDAIDSGSVPASASASASASAPSPSPSPSPAPVARTTPSRAAPRPTSGVSVKPTTEHERLQQEKYEQVRARMRSGKRGRRR